MERDDVDRILSADDEIAPSSGFTASVMDAVRREAASPQPIPFPWKRAVPGLVAASLVGSQAPGPILEAALRAQLHWVVAALLLSFASVTLSMRLRRS